jgi:hypothetical protein
MDVVNKIKIYEVDGEEAIADDRVLIVSSDWDNNKMINIQLENGSTIPPKQSSFFTVDASELRRAIENATNK